MFVKVLQNSVRWELAVGRTNEWNSSTYQKQSMLWDCKNNRNSKMQSQIADFAQWRHLANCTKHALSLILAQLLHYARTWRQRSTTKLDVSNTLQCHQKDQTTATGNTQKIWWNLDIWFLRCEQTDRQKDKQTYKHWLQYFAPTLGAK